MKIEQLTKELQCKVVAGKEGLDNKLSGAYCSDLLSNVMAKAKENNVWITMQGHQNIVAVAVLLGLSGIIVADGAKVDEDTIKKADLEGVPVLQTEMTSYQVAGELYVKGVKE